MSTEDMMATLDQSVAQVGAMKDVIAARYCVQATMAGQAYYVTPQQTLSSYQEAAAVFPSVDGAVRFGELFITSVNFPDEVGRVRVAPHSPQAR